ncbi:MAG TPA: DNA-J related domain-containing protein [Spongiibacteraceae bacterium]|nr:DNA-J related domain-containing protein [Spongiibacteraceae bacterium]
MSAAEQSLNPLLPAVLQLLRAATTGISEYDLLKQLEALGVDFSTLSREPDLLLFQKHFLLMNALYRLQDMLWCEERIWLTITPLQIILEASAELASSRALSAAGSTALRDYYLDWNQLGATDSAAVTVLLNGFWQRFHALDARADALLALQLEADANWTQVQQQYRRLAAATHPDRGGDGAQFLAVREAYEILRGVML